MKCYSRDKLTHLYYIHTDEIPGFFLVLKNHIFIARSEDTIFIFHVCVYWCRHVNQHNFSAVFVVVVVVVVLYRYAVKNEVKEFLTIS